MKTLRAWFGAAVRLPAGALALALAVAAGGPAAAGERLADVMVEAYLNSPAITAQRADIKVASESAVQARAGGRINVTGTIGLQAEVSSVTDTTYPTTLRLLASQPLYTGGQVENATEAAEKRITAEEVILRATEQNVLLSAVTAFIDVRRDGFLLDVATNNVRVLTEQLRAAEERFEVGEVTRTDVEQARAALAGAQSRLAAARGQLEISKENFSEVVGRRPGVLDPPPPIPDLPDSLDQALDIALRTEPSLLAAQIERDASGSDVRAAIGALLPQISLTGELRQSETINDGFDGEQSAAVGIQVTIPFYTGGANSSRVRQAQAGVEGAESRIVAEIRRVLRQTGNAWSSLDVARASISAGRLEVRAAELAFEGVTEEAKVGARTTLDVLDAEEDVLQARANLIIAHRNEYIAAYSMLASMGLLTIEHLGLDTGEPPPGASYYQTVRDRNFGYDASDDTVWSLSYRP